MTTVTLADLLEALNAGQTITGDSPLHAVMHQASQDALRVTAELNSSYHGAAEVRGLLSQLTGIVVDESTTVFPPFYSDFGKNIRLGKRVFINSGCKFQDQGGIVIGDDCLIGHNAVLATLNHDLDVSRRADMHPGRIVIESNVWLGANVTVVPGVTIGKNSVIGAGSVVTKDVPANSVAVGSPARVVRSLPA
ncbi:MULTISPECIES: sugar O-acetyltransferase [unclassified Leifsonia]|uniref:sugar O-acetyltransferase n=1 Tax=unclassified Leifsonia TaxID=2663824 RepID=UPI000701A41F|nr:MULTISPECIES: sugar O-acetyltransferase [unclassified Leifsonia]KQX07703.1 thiamine biosynthesis protein ThiF [Leifsonia sp. Root1293]KRA11985.1 thiamine biosynthesis protein ThiF [Leifsonia sp. Root60]